VREPARPSSPPNPLYILTHVGHLVHTSTDDKLLLASLCNTERVVVQSFLEVTNLSVAFSDRSVQPVCDVSFQVGPGEAVGLLGESGAGKTTLAWALLNLPPAGARLRGTVRFEGVDLLELPERKMRRVRGSQIALIPQEPSSALHPLMPIGNQLREVLRAHGVNHSTECGLRIRSALEEAGLPVEDRILCAYPHQLSGGECQRAAIAQVLACRPRLIIADEPTSSLDATTQSEILGLLRNLKDRFNVALLLITHNPANLEGLADRVLVMSEGRIVESGELAPVFQQPKHHYTQAMLQAFEQLYCGDVRNNGSRSHPVGAPVLRASGLRKVYTRRTQLATQRYAVTALDRLDLTLHRGSSLAIIGRSGCGKSTLGRCLAGLEKADSGEIWIENNDSQSVQYIFQDAFAAMNPRLTITEIISEPYRIREDGNKRERQERALYLMSSVGLPLRLAASFPSELSGGQKQRAVVARALAADARVLIFDECLSGLDLPVQAQIVKLLKGLRDSMDLTYVFILHDLRLAGAVAEEVAVMHSGRIVEWGSPSELFSHPRASQTRLLLASMPGVAD
jgi:peptide/nickel transport system ATP-binding protein